MRRRCALKNPVLLQLACTAGLAAGLVVFGNVLPESSARAAADTGYPNAQTEEWLAGEFNRCAEFNDTYLSHAPEQIGKCFCRSEKARDLLEPMNARSRAFVMDTAERHSEACLNRDAQHPSSGFGSCATSFDQLLSKTATTHGLDRKTAIQTWLKYEMGTLPCSRPVEISKYYDQYLSEEFDFNDGPSDTGIELSDLPDCPAEYKEIQCEISSFLKFFYPDFDNRMTHPRWICPKLVEEYQEHILTDNNDEALLGFAFGLLEAAIEPDRTKLLRKLAQSGIEGRSQILHKAEHAIQLYERAAKGLNKKPSYVDKAMELKKKISFKVGFAEAATACRNWQY